MIIILTATVIDISEFLLVIFYSKTEPKPPLFLSSKFYEVTSSIVFNFISLKSNQTFESYVF